jgi:DNA-binding winged helix-turn-helix (wHTH) protein
MIGDLSIDFNRRQISCNGERIRLTWIEFALLKLLVSRSGEPIQIADLLERVWGYRPVRASDSLVFTVHISRLRAKLEQHPLDPELILTVRGMGYMFQRIVSGYTQPSELPQQRCRGGTARKRLPALALRHKLDQHAQPTHFAEPRHPCQLGWIPGSA